MLASILQKQIAINSNRISFLHNEVEICYCVLAGYKRSGGVNSHSVMLERYYTNKRIQKLKKQIATLTRLQKFLKKAICRVNSARSV